LTWLTWWFPDGLQLKGSANGRHQLPRRHNISWVHESHTGMPIPCTRYTFRFAAMRPNIDVLSGAIFMNTRTSFCLWANLYISLLPFVSPMIQHLPSKDYLVYILWDIPANLRRGLMTNHDRHTGKWFPLTIWPSKNIWHDMTCLSMNVIRYWVAMGKSMNENTQGMIPSPE
jgi:hypothetical protein